MSAFQDGIHSNNGQENEQANYPEDEQVRTVFSVWATLLFSNAIVTVSTPVDNSMP